MLEDDFTLQSFLFVILVITFWSVKVEIFRTKLINHKGDFKYQGVFKRDMEL